MAMKKWQQAYFEGCNDVSPDHARVAVLTSGLQKTIEGLRVENQLLVRDVARCIRARQQCAKLLREAREKNRKLWLRLDKLAGRERAGEG